MVVVGGGGGVAVSKTVDYNGWLTTKNLKKHLLKRPKAEKGNLTKI